MSPKEDSGGGGVGDLSFRVRGTKRMRIADLSVAPVIPSCHPVSVALLIGTWATQKVIMDYDLDRPV